MDNTAKARFEVLHTKRSGVLERARQSSDITIPSILPADGHTEDSPLPSPYQSLGARGVNNLASKMLLALFPSTHPFFRLRMSEELQAQLGGSKAEVENAMRVLENRGQLHIEQGNLRVMVHTALKHMIVTGNALLYMPLNKPTRMFRLNQYVVVRDPSGNVVEILTKESVHPDTLPEKVKAACIKNDGKKEGEKKDCDIFTWVRFADGKVKWHQEINEIKVPDSDGQTVIAESPFIPMRWSAVENEDYGRGLIEEYIGDLRSLEGLSKAIIQFAAAASRIIFMVHPNARTDEDDIADADSGDVITGTAEDVDVLQVEKQADFQAAKAVFDEIQLRLSHAFLLRSGTVRDAERVTAEEIRAQAQELEDVLGGVYTVQSVEMQLPIVRRVLAQMKANGDFPKFPKLAGKDPVTPSIVTGFEALGRTHELNRYREFFADVVGTFGPEALQAFKLNPAIQTFATQHNVDIKEMLKSDEEMAEEQQQAQQSAMMQDAVSKAAGPLAKGAVDAMGETNG